MANLGFVGLGVMGGRMVNRLLDKGHTVTGYNRTRAKAQWLIDRGMKWADSPRAVTAGADFTLSMVTNSAALQEIADGPDGVIAGFVPPSGPEVADKNSQMRMATDATGNLYVADFSTLLRKCIKK